MIWALGGTGHYSIFQLTQPPEYLLHLHGILAPTWSQHYHLVLATPPLPLYSTGGNPFSIHHPPTQVHHITGHCQLKCQLSTSHNATTYGPTYANQMAFQVSALVPLYIGIGTVWFFVFLISTGITSMENKAGLLLSASDTSYNSIP